MLELLWQRSIRFLHANICLFLICGSSGWERWAPVAAKVVVRDWSTTFAGRKEGDKSEMVEVYLAENL